MKLTRTQKKIVERMASGWQLFATGNRGSIVDWAGRDLETVSATTIWSMERRFIIDCYKHKSHPPMWSFALRGKEGRVTAESTGGNS